MALRTYVARQPGPFSALLQARSLAGFGLRPLPPRRVNDRYEDTDDGALLAEGLTLRLREQEGEWSAALRPVRRGAGRSVEAAFGVAWAPPEGELPVPPGPLADAVQRIVGSDPVSPLLRLRQYRTPRLAYDQGRLVALLSFDVVVYEVPGANVVSNELEVELGPEGTDADLGRLEPVLRDHGLEPVALTKLERGVLRLHRGLDEPVLLLPGERAALDGLVASPDAPLQRRARVVLLDARGYRTVTIAGQVGLSTSRVRHWQQQFRAHRMGIFESEDASDRDPLRAVPTYRVSEIVENGEEPTPAKSAPVERPNEASAPPDEASAPPDEVSAPPDEVSGTPTPEPKPARPPTSIGDGSPSQVPFADGPTVRLSDDARSGPVAGEPGPDESGADAEPHDMAALLELFHTSDTGTPLLVDDEPLVDEDRADERLTEEELVHEPLADEEGIDPAGRVGPDATRTPVALPELSAPGSPDTGLGAGRRAEPSAPTPSAAASHRRAFLAPETPILDAARRHARPLRRRLRPVVARFASEPTPRTAQRLLLAAHRVRLAVEAFDAYVPEAAAARLVSVLRPLAASLDHVVELDRVVEAGVDAAATARDEALDAARRHLTPDRHRVWMARADRVVGRLAEQVRSGLLWATTSRSWATTGWGGLATGPSRRASATFWRRWSGTATQSVRAFEDDVDDRMSMLTAHHLAVAVSGLHFALGLASKASDARAVREAAAQLDEAERVVAAFRTAARGRLGGRVRPTSGTRGRRSSRARSASCSGRSRRPSEGAGRPKTWAAAGSQSTAGRPLARLLPSRSRVQTSRAGGGDPAGSTRLVRSRSRDDRPDVTPRARLVP